MRLEELQKKLIGHITDPHVHEADFSVIVSQKGISPEQRLGSYRNSCLNRLTESFKGDFEVSLNFLGEEVFEYHAREFLHLHPSQTHYINELGKDFSVFLQNCEELESYPFLSEIINLEWRMVESFYNFSNREQNKSDQSQIWVNPSLIFVTSSWPLDKIWNELMAYPEEETFLVSWSHMDRVSRLLSLNEIEYTVLRSLFETRSLEKTIDSLENNFTETDLLSIFQDSLSLWVKNGLIELS
jgi:hypothetical protein